MCQRYQNRYDNEALIKVVYLLYKFFRTMMLIVNQIISSMSFLESSFVSSRLKHIKNI